eukprot:scaffold4485_cov135-Isochrysis_galbana.AAC.7
MVHTWRWRRLRGWAVRAVARWQHRRCGVCVAWARVAWRGYLGYGLRVEPAHYNIAQAKMCACALVLPRRSYALSS